MSDQFDVGSIVRAERCTKHGTRCLARAMVATKQNDTICIIWEELYPRPIMTSTSADDMRAYSSRNFLITPKSINREPKDDDDDDDEVTVNIEKIQALLPFENNNNTNTNTPNESESTLKPLLKKNVIIMWKERGDQILRLGDPSSATSYYEKALFNSSHLSIGGTIIISVEGFPMIAEVDCVEDDDGIIDVTLVSSGEDRTIKNSTVLLSIMERDDDLLQERILLNLARCMLQLSDLDVVDRPKYLKSAILSTTIAITISSFRQQQQDEDDNDQSLLQANAQTALVLRVKAYSGLSKWSKAIADAKRLIKNGNKQQGNKLLSSIERKKKLQLKTDKKLAKDICRLVQSATEATTTTTTTGETTTADLNGSSSSSTVKSVSSSKSSSYYLTNDIGRINNKNKSSSSSSSSFETKQHNNIIYPVEGTSSQDKISQFLLQRPPASNLILGLCSVFILPIIAAVLISQYYQKTGQ
jgi:Na+-transporting NADH:ubiquinone oxidoreductase subunit NqrC